MLGPRQGPPDILSERLPPPYGGPVTCIYVKISSILKHFVTLWAHYELSDFMFKLYV